ncbi:hypothetical protein DAI22_11g186660 [Oryza sativa Japonica Group]|nr:hypothetical protein DAI22_11g186660 [Oryza sativa Japonica Group]
MAMDNVTMAFPGTPPIHSNNFASTCGRLRRGWDLNAIPQSSLADVPRPVLELAELDGRSVLRDHLAQGPVDPPEVSPESTFGTVDLRVPAVEVEVDAVVAVLREQAHLVHPGAHLLVVPQEAVHALHLLLDELHIVPDAAKQHSLVADDHQQ